jgi:hypothetical protein
MSLPTPAARVIDKVASLPGLHPRACGILVMVGGLLLLLSAVAGRKAAGDEPKRPARVSAYAL